MPSLFGFSDSLLGHLTLLMGNQSPAEAACIPGETWVENAQRW